MQIPYSRWHHVIKNRRSRRNFHADKPIQDDVLQELKKACEEFRPFSCVRTELITSDYADIFRGVIGSFGKIKNPQAAIAFIGDTTDRHYQEKVGYTGEGIILEATSLNLGTCWVGGFFRPKIVTSLIKLEKTEKVLAVTPLGYPVDIESLEEKIATGFGRTHERKPLSSIIYGVQESQLPGWIRISLEAARLAPSAINRQPWKFAITPSTIKVSINNSGNDFGVSKRLDCGIAMLHIDVAAGNNHVKGVWEFMEHPDVALYKLQ